jgi:Cu-processing system permease protein
MALLVPSLLLGAAFLSLGFLISAIVSRQVTAASLVVTTWFLLVFFYDLGLLGLLVASDGRMEQATVVKLVFANPAGLFRVQMMEHFSGPDALETLGITAALPGRAARALINAAWVLLPLGVSALLLRRQKVAK